MSDYRIHFITAIKTFYPESFDTIISQTDKHYRIISVDTEFARTSKNPIDRRLDFCAYFLALIKTLDEQAESFEQIRRICIHITTEYVKPKNKMQSFIKRLIPKLTNTWLSQMLIKQLDKKVSSNENPDGFVAKIITDKSETFGFGYGVDILECGICKLFKKYNYEKYASILCEVDEITSAMAGLKLIRKGTIAKGAKKCDFRFERIQSLLF